MTHKKKIDWAAIKEKYEAGEKSVRQIAREHGVSHTAIGKKARDQNWERDVSEDANRLAALEEQRALGETREERTRALANKRLQIQIKHQRLTARIGEFLDNLLSELERLASMAVPPAEEIEWVKEKINMIRTLGLTADKIQPLERLANNLPGKVSPEDTAGKGEEGLQVINYVMFGDDPPPASSKEAGK